MSTHIGKNVKGLKLLVEPSIADTQEPGIVDIVAIHDLCASPDDTWRKYSPEAQNGNGSYINWLEDPRMLPAVASNARIMRYGYESNWFGRNAIRTSVTDVAQRLLISLRRYRESCTKRPLIFIGHGFGGLVAMQAILEARAHDEEWRFLYKTIAGVMFLNTPLRGACGMLLDVSLEAASKHYSRDQIQEETLRILQPSDDFLNFILDDFNRTRHGQHQTIVSCFWARKTSNIANYIEGHDKMGYLADRSSAQLDPSESTRNYSLSLSHADVTKFDDPNDEDYQLVRDSIEEMVRAAPVLVERRLGNPFIYGSSRSTIESRLHLPSLVWRLNPLQCDECVKETDVTSSGLGSISRSSTKDT